MTDEREDHGVVEFPPPEKRQRSEWRGVRGLVLPAYLDYLPPLRRPNGSGHDDGHEYVPYEELKQQRRSEEGPPPEGQRYGNGEDRGFKERLKCQPLGEPITFASFADKVPEPHPFAWGNYIPERVPGMLTGDGETGKTIFFNEYQVAASQPEAELLGMAVKQMRTLALYTESSKDQINIRIRMIAEARGIKDLNALGDMARCWCRVGQSSQLFVPNRHGEIITTPLYEEIYLYVEKHEIGAVLLDNIGPIFKGDRNDEAHIDTVVRTHFAALCKINGAFVISAFHPSRGAMRDSDGGGGWSTEWRNSHRFVLAIKKVERDDISKGLTIEREKCNDAADARPKPIKYFLKGRLQREGRMTAAFAAGENHRCEGLVIDTVAAFTASSLYIARSKNSPASNIVAMLKSHPGICPKATEAAKHDPQALFDAVDRLMGIQLTTCLAKGKTRGDWLCTITKEEEWNGD